MSASIWEAVDAAEQQREARMRALGDSRPLTDDERAVVALLATEEFRAFQRIVSERSGLSKSKLYRDNLSGQEFLTGRLLGEIKTLEWLATYPTSLLARQEKHHERQRSEAEQVG